MHTSASLGTWSTWSRATDRATSAVFGARFERFLPRVLPRVLGGLADEAEPVRDASMRAAQAVIATGR